MANDELWGLIQGQVDQIASKIALDRATSFAFARDFVLLVMGRREIEYGSLRDAVNSVDVTAPSMMDDRGIIVAGGWHLYFGTMSIAISLPDELQGLPKISDIAMGVKLFGLDYELIDKWLSYSQYELRDLDYRDFVIQDILGRLSVDDIEFVHKAMSVYAKLTGWQPHAICIPDVRTLSVIGKLSRAEIVALVSPARIQHDHVLVREQLHPYMIPNLLSLQRYRDAPEDRKFYWKFLREFTAQEKERLFLRFPGIVRREDRSGQTAKLIDVARGIPPSQVFPELTAKEVHEFLYTTDWHRIEVPHTPYGYLTSKLNLVGMVFDGGLRQGQCLVLRWLRHIFDKDSDGAICRRRTFIDAYGMTYRSAYALRIDEVYDRHITRIGESLATVFARVDQSLRDSINESGIDLDKPLAEIPPLGDYLPEGWQFLNTRRQLIGEGRRMKHCVAGYHASVAQGHCCILSICDDDGMSTAELMGMNYGRGTSNFAPYQIVQFKSVRNGAPPRNHVNKFTRLRWAYEVMCTFKSELEEKDPKAIWVNPCKALIVRVLSDPTNPRTTQLYETKALPIIDQSHWPIGMAHWLLCEMFEHHRAEIDEIMSAFQADWPSKGVTL